MYDVLGKIFSDIPLWISLPIAFLIVLVVTAVWMIFFEPLGDEVFTRWRSRRKREKELRNAKK